MNNHEDWKLLVAERHLLSYLQLLKSVSSKCLIIITVCDTGAAPYFTAECASSMMQLGLKTNMFTRFRQPYIAIIDHGEVLAEKVTANLDEPLVYKTQLNGHNVFVYSAGFFCQREIGCRSLVLIDGVNYLNCERGFNFFVFDTEKDCIIDECNFDTYDMGRCHRVKTPEVPALQSFKKRFSGVFLCTLKMPKLPSKHYIDATQHEKFIVQHLEKFHKYFNTNRNDIVRMKNIYENKEFHFCHDFETFEQFYDAFNFPDFYINLDGSYRFFDYSGASVNTQNGMRITISQPRMPKRAIFFIGPSHFFCWGASDSNTFESFLQKKLNQYCTKKGFIVYNVAFNGENLSRDISNLRSLPIKKGDIIFFHSKVSIWGIPCCDLSLSSIRPHDYGEIFIDTHLSRNGNRLVADGIFNFLEEHSFFEKELPLDAGTPIWDESGLNVEESEELREYKQQLRTVYRYDIAQRIGSIVMNCNPFTLGHRYLVEQALKQCDYLVIFIVEEDKSLFSFKDRFTLARKNLDDVKKVSIIPSGKFVISTRTFKEYFNKEDLQEQIIDATLDVTLFAKEIAPCLNINMRFVGDEILDSVTRQYNENMARILPQYGIKFVEIPRLEWNGTPINASYVRRLAKMGQFEELKEFVSKETLQYLMKIYEYVDSR